MLFIFCAFLGSINAQETSAPVILDIDTAFQNVLERSIELKISETAIQITEAQIQQAAVYPNPDLSLSFDTSSGGSGRRDQWEPGDATLTITQEFELGGKRSARIRFASMAQCVAYWDYEILKLDMYTSLIHAFIDISTAQEKLKIAEESQKLTEETLGCLEEKVKSGKIPPQQQKKGKIDCINAERTLAKAKTQLRLAKEKLSALWESHNPDFDQVEYSFYELGQPPSLCVLTQRLDDTPDLAREKANIVLANENIAVERANRIPSLGVSTGVEAYDEDGGTSFFFGFDAAIPVFDRNQGNIAKAYLQKQQAEFKEHDLKHHNQIKLTSTYEELRSLYEESLSLKNVVMPATQESLQTVEESYKEGKSEYKDVLDNKKAFLDIQAQYIDSLAQFHHKKADIERLTTVVNDE